MDVVVGRESHTMNIARPALPQASFMTFVKGIGGCAFVALCFSGAIAAGLKLPFGFAAQSLATTAGAVIGGIVTWYAGRPSAQR